MSNEDLLREGECPHPNCIEPVGHGGFRSGAMTREEALKAVEDFVLYLEFIGTAPNHAAKVREAHAVLSSPCACEGREPLLVVNTAIPDDLPNGEFARWLEWPPGHGVRRDVRIVVLPAEETA